MREVGTVHISFSALFNIWRKVSQQVYYINTVILTDISENAVDIYI